MAMIEVKHLQKNFVKTVKEPGLKGALRSFIHPEKQTFEAVKDLTFEVPKGQILGFIGANGAGKSTTIKVLTGILNRHLVFVGLMARFHRIIARIMSRILGLFLDNELSYGGTWPCKRLYTVLKGDLRSSQTRSSTSAWIF